MSRVTNLLLTVDFDDAGMTKEINSYFDGSYRPQGFLLASGSGDTAGIDEEHMWYGGGKMLEAVVFAGAFNHLDLEALKAHLRSLSWKEPQFVQLMFTEQEDNVWHLEYLFPEMPRQEKY